MLLLYDAYFKLLNVLMDVYKPYGIKRVIFFNATISYYTFLMVVVIKFEWFSLAAQLLSLTFGTLLTGTLIASVTHF